MYYKVDQHASMHSIAVKQLARCIHQCKFLNVSFVLHEFDVNIIIIVYNAEKSESGAGNEFTWTAKEAWQCGHVWRFYPGI